MKVLTLLSIVVPVGLLTTLRLTGILQGPITISETITLEAVKREIERPYATIDIEEKDQSLYDGDIAINQRIDVASYDQHNWDYGGSSAVVLPVNVTASITLGYIENVRLTFYDSYLNARINFFEEHQLLKLQNLSIVNLKDWASEAFIILNGVNRPGRVSLWAPVHWVFRSQNNQTHKLDVLSEVVYFNGTVHKNVVQPFEFKIAPDNNDSFETAQEIHDGHYPKLFIGPPDIGDVKDYYKIYATQGQRIGVYVNGLAWSMPIFNGTSYLSPIFNVTDWSWSWLILGETWDPSWPANPLPNFSLYLYDPERNLVAAKEENYIQDIDFVANSTGFWFIEVRIFENFGFYSLGVNQ